MARTIRRGRPDDTARILIEAVVECKVRDITDSMQQVEKTLEALRGYGDAKIAGIEIVAGDGDEES